MAHETQRMNRNANYDSNESEIIVHFKYMPGYPVRGPSYSSGGEPACDPEIEILQILQAGIDVTDNLSDTEMLGIQAALEDNWEDDSWDQETDRQYLIEKEGWLDD